QLEISEAIGEDAKAFFEWTYQGLKSFAKYAYIPETNSFKTLLTNGSDLTDYRLKRNGYYGKAGQKFKSYFAHFGFLLSYARAFLNTQDNELWEMTRQIAQGNGIGDLGHEPGRDVVIKFDNKSSAAMALFQILDLSQKTNCK